MIGESAVAGAPSEAARLEGPARVARALGSAHRLQLLHLLAQGERSVEALAAEAGLRLTTASAHLQVLRAAGLVTVQRAGRRRLHRLAGYDVAALCVMLRRVAEARPAGSAAAPPDAMPRAELRRRLGARGLALVDARPALEYAAGHIPGAVSWPGPGDARPPAPWPAGATAIVVYGRGAECRLAGEALRAIRGSGRQARPLQDGMLEWRLAGLPVEPGATAGAAGQLGM